MELKIELLIIIFDYIIDFCVVDLLLFSFNLYFYLFLWLHHPIISVIMLWLNLLYKKSK